MAKAMTPEMMASQCDAACRAHDAKKGGGGKKGKANPMDESKRHEAKRGDMRRDRKEGMGG